MDECVLCVLALAVLARMGIEFTHDFGITSRDDGGGPVRVECKFEGLDFQVHQVFSGTEQIVSKGSAAYVIVNVGVCHALILNAGVRVAASSNVQPAQEGLHVQEKEER